MATSSSTTQSEKRLTATSNWFSSGLRPITMTRLVAMLGLLPAAVSHGIGSDSQRPFAIVIVRGFGSLAAIQKS